ncbi:IS3 family transposase [Lysinibacillus sp. S2017]
MTVQTTKATYKSFKIEFVYQMTYESLEQLEINNIRIHQTLGYLTPAAFK